MFHPAPPRPVPRQRPVPLFGTECYGNLIQMKTDTVHSPQHCMTCEQVGFHQTCRLALVQCIILHQFVVQSWYRKGTSTDHLRILSMLIGLFEPDRPTDKNLPTYHTLQLAVLDCHPWSAKVLLLPPQALSKCGWAGLPSWAVWRCPAGSLDLRGRLRDEAGYRGDRSPRSRRQGIGKESFTGLSSCREERNSSLQCLASKR